MRFFNNVKKGVRLIFSYKGLEIFWGFLFVISSLIALFVGVAILSSIVIMPALFLPSMILMIVTETGIKMIFNLILVSLFIITLLFITFTHFFIDEAESKSLTLIKSLLEDAITEIGTVAFLVIPLWLIQLFYIFEYIVGSAIAFVALKYIVILATILLIIFFLYKLGKNHS